MAVLFLCSSPKADQSLSYQYCRFFCSLVEDCDTSIEFVGREPDSWQKNRSDYVSLVAKIKAASAVVFVSPVYYHHLPSQLLGLFGHFEEEGRLFAAKPVLLVTLSNNLFDHLPHAYFQRLMKDWKALAGPGLYPEAEDLLNPRRRQSLGAAMLFWLGEYLPAVKPAVPAAAAGAFVLLVLDDATNPKLNRMIDGLEQSLSLPVRRFDVTSPGLSSGCRGCLSCRHNGSCVIPDAVAKVHSGLLDQAAAVLFCGEIQQHFFSPRFKAFIDRWYFRGAQPVLAGKAVGLLTPSQIEAEPEFLAFFQSLSVAQGGRWAACLGGERLSAAKAKQKNLAFAKRLEWLVAADIELPSGFIGAAGHALRRDYTRAHFGREWLSHSYLRRHGGYDYPQCDPIAGLRNIGLLLLSRLPFLRRRAALRLRDSMLRPFKRLLD